MAGGSLQIPDDFELMSAICAGDRSALSALYDRHSPMILAICRRVVKNAGEAEDVMTDVFFEVWSKSARFDATRGSPLTYLITLARSRSIDRKRSIATRPVIASDNTDTAGRASSALNPQQSIALTEQRGIVQKALAELEPAQREALECSFYDGLSHSEISEKLQKPLGTVKTYIRQGLIRLRESLRTNQ